MINNRKGHCPLSYKYFWKTHKKFFLCNTLFKFTHMETIKKQTLEDAAYKAATFWGRNISVNTLKEDRKKFEAKVYRKIMDRAKKAPFKPILIDTTFDTTLLECARESNIQWPCLPNGKRVVILEKRTFVMDDKETIEL